MPLLKRGPEVYPQGLFDLQSVNRPWTVAHTRSRQEKALVRHLEPLEVAFYLPQYERRVRRSGRDFVSFIPLFPGYVFLRCDAPARDVVFRSGLVVRLLDVRDQDLLDAELRQLRSLQLSGASLAPYERLVPGDIVTIADGPFRGHRGRVVREQSGLRLIVSISMLRKSVAVEFDRSCLKREARPTGSGEDRSAVA